MATRRRGRYTNSDIVWAIEQASDVGLEPVDIHKLLIELKAKRDRRFPVNERVPSLRTVQDIVAKHSRDDSARWQLADADLDDIPIILPFVKYAHVHDEGFGVEGKEYAPGPVTRAKAEWIIRIHHAAPDLPPPVVWNLVHYYVSRKSADPTAQTADLDLLLAFAPWRSVGEFEGFSQALGSLDMPVQNKEIVLLLAESAAIWADKQEGRKPDALTTTAVRSMRARQGQPAKEEEANDGKGTHSKAGKQVGSRGARRPRREREA